MLQYVLLSLPDQLRNKTLILGGGSDVRNLCVSLCCMVSVFTHFQVYFIAKDKLNPLLLSIEVVMVSMM